MRDRGERSPAPTTSFMAKAFGVFHVTAGLGALAVVVLPHWSDLRPAPVAALGFGALGYGGLVLIVGHRLPSRGFSVALVVSTAMATGVAWAAGAGAGTAAGAVLYVPLGLFAAVLLSRIGLAIQIGLTGAAYALCLALQHQRGGPAQWLAALATTVVSSLVVRWLVEHVRAVARSDGLTGVANRMAWEELLERHLAIAERGRAPFVVALLDLDRFKEVNASLGHRGGDELLVALSAAWRRQLRPEDELARYGGDEFTVLLPHTTMGDAERVVDRLRSAGPANGSFSAGLAQWQPGEAADELMARADRALFGAKAQGRGRHVVDAGPALRPIAEGA